MKDIDYCSKFFDEYQEMTRSTAIYPEELKLIYPTIGLAGETGEVSEKVKKFLRDKTAFEYLQEDLEKELGDVLWYIARVADDAGLKLSDIASANLHKLRRRKEKGKLQGSGDDR